MNIIDLRSDTVTHPTEAMREAMARAEVGDDGLGDDPTVIRLEELAAERLGKEAGLYTPTGTMANTLAMMAHSGRGGEVIIEAAAHIIRAEMGAIATVAGLHHRALGGVRGVMDLDEVRETIRPKLGPRNLGTALICMENTHNAAGGAVLPLNYMAALKDLAAANGIPLHLDGARLFNAATALGVRVGDLSRHADSVCFCVSKGLSAPVGSVLVGDTDFITRARLLRRMLGGAMRQAGIMAAAAIIAIEEMPARLGEDHANARRLAVGLNAIDPSLTDPESVETNIVMVDLDASGRRADAWVEDLAGRGVRASAKSAYRIRLVVHRLISTADIDAAVAEFADLWGKGAAAAD